MDVSTLRPGRHVIFAAPEQFFAVHTSLIFLGGGPTLMGCVNVTNSVDLTWNSASGDSLYPHWGQDPGLPFRILHFSKITKAFHVYKWFECFG